jgi:hypothetical protein
MAHAQKLEFLLSAKRTSPFKSAGASVQSTTGSRGVRISGSNAGYNIFRGSVKGTGYPLHSPVSPSIPLPCVTVCFTFQLDSTSAVPSSQQSVIVVYNEPHIRENSTDGNFCTDMKGVATCIWQGPSVLTLLLRLSGRRKRNVISAYRNWYLIYLLTALGFTPSGSSTVHIHTQTIHRTTQLTTLVESLTGIRTQSG